MTVLFCRERQEFNLKRVPVVVRTITDQFTKGDDDDEDDEELSRGTLGEKGIHIVMIIIIYQNGIFTFLDGVGTLSASRKKEIMGIIFI